MKFSEQLRRLRLHLLAPKNSPQNATRAHQRATGGSPAFIQNAEDPDEADSISKRERKAQRGYYQLASAKNSLDQRIDSLACAIPAGSTILDIGCNDGTISSALIDRGVVKKAYAIDLENILVRERPEISFIEADIRTLDIASLPQANGVLLLNILHHLIRSSRRRAQEILDGLLDRYEFVLVDLGSFSEQDDRGWRRVFARHWKSDAEMWDSLFHGAAWRFKILRYPTQGSGHRVLWKLYRNPYELKSFSVEQAFVKTPGTWPGDKELIPVDDVNSLEKPPPGRVMFEKIISAQQDVFWVKRYLAPWRPGVAAMEYEIWREVSKVLQERKLHSKDKYSHLGLSKLVDFPNPNAVCAIYEPDLMDAAAVHFQDWIKFFDPSDTYMLGSFAARTIGVKGLRRVKIIHICDFQAASAWDGIKLLDFEPNFWARSFLLPK